MSKSWVDPRLLHLGFGPNKKLVKGEMLIILMMSGRRKGKRAARVSLANPHQERNVKMRRQFMVQSLSLSGTLVKTEV